MKSLILKISFLFIFTLYLIPYTFSQDIIFDWKHIIGNGTSQNEGKCIATDSAGYVYVGGIITGTITFLDTTINATGTYESFVAKLTPDGNLVWFKWFRSIFCRIESICIDRENKLYVTGIYGNSVSFDTIIHSNNADSASITNMFIAKFDTSGALLWAKNTQGVDYVVGDYGAEPLKKLTVDNDNNLIVTGRCIDNLQYFDTTVIVNTSYPHTGFLAKYTSQGQKLWIKKIGGVNCNPYAVKTDNANNILVTGNFIDSTLFDGVHLISNWSGADNIFLVKYNSTGTLNWVERAGGTGGSYGYDIAIDSVDNIYLTGEFSSNYVEFDSIVYYNASSEGFIVKYNQGGNLVWLTPIGNSHSNHSVECMNMCASIHLFNNELYVLGSFYKDSLIFNGTTLVSFNRYNTFLLKMDLNGNFIKAGQYLGPAWAWPQELSLDSEGNIYIAEIIGSNICIAKILSGFPVNNILTENNLLFNPIIYPNPCSDKLFISTGNLDEHKCQVEIFDITGKLTLSEMLQYDNHIDVSAFSKGIYIIRLSNKTNKKKIKLIIQ